MPWSTSVRHLVGGICIYNVSCALRAHSNILERKVQSRLAVSDGFLVARLDYQRLACLLGGLRLSSLLDAGCAHESRLPAFGLHADGDPGRSLTIPTTQLRAIHDDLLSD